MKETLARTTQYARMPMSTYLKWRFKSPYPALNVHHRNEPVATDTVYSDTPAINGGETYAQIFVGTESLVTDVEGMKTDKQFVNMLEDNIRPNSSLIVLRLRSVLRSKTFYGLYVSRIGRANPTNSIRTLLNVAIRL